MGTTFASLVNLDHYGHYINWHFISISAANLTVIVVMVLTFLAALVVPFPGKRSRKEKT